MTTAIVKPATAAVDTAAAFTDEQVALIKRTIAKGATDDELALFVATANRLGLDPFARQIFAVKRGNLMTIQVSIDGFRLVADRTGKYAPGKPTHYEHDDHGKLICATVFVKKHAAGEWHEVGETAYLTEYAQASNALWKTMPRAMLAKCAEARALRRAFPAELSGAYAPEEMDQSDRASPPVRQSVSPSPFRAPEREVILDAEVIEDTAKSLLERVQASESVAVLQSLASEIAKQPEKVKAELRSHFGTRMRQLKQAEAQREVDAIMTEDEEVAG